MPAFMVSFALASAGCAAHSDTEGVEAGEEIGEAELAWQSQNGLYFETIRNTSLLITESKRRDLLDSPLSGAGLSVNNKLEIHRDPKARELMTYLAKCALEGGTNVDYWFGGVRYLYRGALGVARYWSTEACGANCQKWVSACMLAHLNRNNDPIDINAVSWHVAGGSASFPREESTYWGNIFAADSDQRRFACYTNRDLFYSRVCGDDLANCGGGLLHGNGPGGSVAPCSDSCFYSDNHGSVFSTYRQACYPGNNHRTMSVFRQ
jgi:hypothetical protein